MSAVKTLRSVKIQAFIYSTQMFTLLASAAILSFQYELFMLDRGVSLPIALIIFSCGQVLMMTSNIAVRRFLDKIPDPIIILKIGIIIRTSTMLAMFFTTNAILFIILFLVYQTIAVSNIIFESTTATWAFDNNISFSNMRLYGSFGFATAGFMVSFLYSLTGSLNFILLFLFCLNFYNLVIIFHSKGYKTSKKEKINENEEIKDVDKKLRSLIIMVAVTLAFSNAFNVILNNHYRYFFHLTVEHAILMVSISVLLGSFVAEIFGLKSVDFLTKKITPQKTIFVGILLSFFRWSISIFAPNYVGFALTYLFHGFCFAYLYMGCLAYAKENYGNQITKKAVLELIIFMNLCGIIFVQLTNLVVELFNTHIVLFMYSAVSAIVVALFWFFYVKKV